MNCKDCKFFVQGEGKSGTCQKRPYFSARGGRPQIIQGKPRKFITFGSSNACKTYFERKGAE